MFFFVAHCFSYPGVGFHLNKQEFRDALYICYNWQLQNVPIVCVCVRVCAHVCACVCVRVCVCGISYSINLVRFYLTKIICHYKGLTFVRHNELWSKCYLAVGSLPWCPHRTTVAATLLWSCYTSYTANRCDDASYVSWMCYSLSFSLLRLLSWSFVGTDLHTFSGHSATFIKLCLAESHVDCRRLVILMAAWVYLLQCSLQQGIKY